MKLSEEIIKSLAPNEQAIKNGKDLLSKNKFVKLEKSKDDTYYSGECEGSGKDNYLVSVDFINEAKPVFRCSCPSRQIPCKHALGLLFAINLKKKFKEIEIPEDIIKKREKQEKSQEKKLAEPKEKKVNVNALNKKIDMQLEGMTVLEKIINDITVYGLGTLNIKQVRVYEELAKKLGDYYLPGLQSKFKEFLNCFIDQNNISYNESLIKLSDLYNLLIKGREYLIKKKEDLLLNIDIKSSIEEQLGTVWQLTQLKELGLVKTNVNIIELTFNEINDVANNQFIDQGIWICLDDGEIYQTLNYRPYKAKQYIKEDDSCFKLITLKEMYIYPSEFNNRIRYEDFTDRTVKEEDLKKIISFSKTNYNETVKNVKNIIKNPLSGRVVYSIINFSRIGKVENKLVIENINNERITLYGEYLENIYLLNNDMLHNGVMLGSFQNNFDTGNLEFKALSIINEKQIIRLAF